MKILVDADSCPALVRDIILKAANRTGHRAVFAANRIIPGLWGNAVMEVCAETEGAADDRILELAGTGDLVITRDIPLAKRLIEKDITAMDDRGRIFTGENIGEYYSLRCFQVELAQSGAEVARIAHYGKKELKSFANNFDKLLARLGNR